MTDLTSDRAESSGCPEALSRLDEFLDGEMTDEEIAEVSAHLARCYPCGDRADFERHLREVVRSCADEAAPAGLLEKVRRRCREESERAAGAASAGGTGA